MYTVIKKKPELVIKEKYRLTGNNNFCVPVEDVMVDDTQSLVEIVILEHDQRQMQAPEMNELIACGALCFDNPDEYLAWKNKNVIEYDDKGNPIGKSLVDKLIDMIGI